MLFSRDGTCTRDFACVVWRKQYFTFFDSNNPYPKNKNVSQKRREGMTFAFGEQLQKNSDTKIMTKNTVLFFNKGMIFLFMW